MLVLWSNLANCNLIYEKSSMLFFRSIVAKCSLISDQDDLADSVQISRFQNVLSKIPSTNSSASKIETGDLDDSFRELAGRQEETSSVMVTL